MDFQKLLKLYDYVLPKKLIAQSPASPRDSARLLVYDRKTGKIISDLFWNLEKYLPNNSLLVFNRTRVIPARLKVKKETGGKAEILYTGHDNNIINALSNRALPVGSRVTIVGNFRKNIYLKILKKKGNLYGLNPNCSMGNFLQILKKYGKTPLPPYLKNSPLTEKQRRHNYQTVFANSGNSIAAPTASLHFTKKLITKLRKQGISVKFVELNVNLGTFAPLTEQNLKTNKLHTEDYSIDKKTWGEINFAKKLGRPIIAVGTTVARTLESAAAKNRLSGKTNLFIYPEYKFKLINGLVTNFHVPKSSLMMLVSALVGRKKLLAIYRTGVIKGFRFFSFGDGMLIL